MSPTGSDANPGTSAARPLQTLAAVNRLSLAAGDAVLLQGGATFAGTLTLGADDGGTTTAPVTVSSYGTGRATISAGDGDGIDVLDTSGVAISNLNVEGDSPGNDTSQGINLFNDRSTGGRLDQGVAIDAVDVGGFGLYGIGIGAATVTYGFDHVRITNATLHDNAESGLQTYAGDYTANPAPYGLAHADLYLAHVSAYDNPGNTAHLDSGDGILLGDVSVATVEHCVAHDNGLSHDGGPAGIWTYNSDRVTIQYNESYHNGGGKTDGDGFDLDGGTTHALLQYNYSHDNDGAGLLLCQFADATTWSGNVVRYNVSQDDGRRNHYGGIDLYTPDGDVALADSQVYGNTVYVSAVGDGSTTPSGLRDNATTDGLAFYNNLFDVAAGMPPIYVAGTGTGLTFAGNDYWAGSATDLGLSWLGTTYDTLDDWRSATGQETLNGTATGLAADPALVDAGGGSTPTDADALATDVPAYRLTAASPLVDAGVSLTGLGIDPGPTDFYGSAVPQGAGFDVGANEYVAGSFTSTVVSVAVAAPQPPLVVGTPITVTAQVTSTGTAAAATGAVWFSLGDGTVIGQVAVPADGTAAITTAALPAGNDVVTATYGGDATHPAATGSVRVTVNPLALAPTVVRTTVPTTVVAGAKTPARGQVTLTVTNTTANVESGRAQVALFAAPAGVPDASAVAVATASRPVSLRPGRSVTVAIPVTALPATLPAGSYTWVARVTDPAGRAAVSPAGPAFTVAPPTVQLSATVRSAGLKPLLVAPGRRIAQPVTLSVTNTGNTATTAPLSATLYLSTTGQLDGSAVGVGTVRSKVVVRPGKGAVTLTVRPSAVPATVAAGTYTLLVAVADAAGHSTVTVLPTAVTLSAG